MTEQPKMFTGRCLCGAVTYEVDGPLRDVVACHCSQCRRTSGHHVAATAGSQAGFRLIKQDGLSWFRSSDDAERGFCHACGSNLFYRRFDADTISIFAGTLDQTTGLRMTTQLYPEDKADYYEIDPTVDVIDQKSLVDPAR